ncbi:uncharacterized protein [Macrobrachium rosenbergii]|uniref:uncharacterized protein n=1 Tax=Macrobrachium rosenbergii TaxID=79674 RepID=UPI0034D4DEA7
MKRDKAFLALILIVTLNLVCSLEQCRQTYLWRCSTISLLSGTPNGRDQDVLEELCKAGIWHVEKQSSFKGQLAVINIHRDASPDDALRWFGGQCPNVVCNDTWFLDELVPLPTGRKGTGNGTYQWYRHGLPLWPLLYQSLSHAYRRPVRLILRKKLYWPNYALAMPVYHVRNEYNRTRRPGIAVMKLFKPDLSGVSFSKPFKFKRFVDSFMKNFQNTVGSFYSVEIEFIEGYDKWLKPLVIHSLPKMLKSNVKNCKAELYIFLQKKPILSFIDELYSDLNDILKAVKCPHIPIIIGYQDS